MADIHSTSQVQAEQISIIVSLKLYENLAKHSSDSCIKILP